MQSMVGSRLSKVDVATHSHLGRLASFSYVRYSFTFDNNFPIEGLSGCRIVGRCLYVVVRISRWILICITQNIKPDQIKTESKTCS